MPRKDVNGRELQPVLSYELGQRVTAAEMHRALHTLPGLKSHTSFTNRTRAEDFPNAEECRAVAAHFGINPMFLLVTFGLISKDEIDEYRGSNHFVSGGRVQATLTALPPMWDRRPTPSEDEPVRIRNLGPHALRKL